ncbi:MAG: 50S ribosomal protein L5 [Candidatus Gracilibacteria bacterium]|nr:50S ribosomal protein L5 [Candidatus Gracilibacteria bacterium]
MSLKEKYKNEIVSKFKDNLKVENVMEIPKLEKVVLNMGIGTYIRTGNKDYNVLKDHLALIAGQAPTVRYARKSISNFKLREGMPVGLSVTLRGDAMYNFLDKLINIVLPRVRDFRGISKNSFDKEGNYNFGIKEHSIFLEVPQDDIVKNNGIQITVKTTAKNKEMGKELLTMMGFPFSK